jgi:hypothetical protein
MPVEPSEPYREQVTRVVASACPDANSASANDFAARIGPTVWELDGPIPMVKRSRAETYAVTQSA